MLEIGNDKFPGKTNDESSQIVVNSLSLMSIMPVDKLALVSQLNLSRSALVEVPAVIWTGMPLLAHLNLSFNQIQSIYIPDNNCARLKYLNLSCNRLLSLDFLYGLADGLEQLYVAGNQISVVPGNVAVHLKVLELGSECLGGNLLSEIDPICCMTAITNLDISHNLLSYLPDRIGRLSGLKCFSAVNNQISYMPSSVGELVHLESLTLARNRITVMPNELAMLTSLKSIDLSRNMINHVDSGLLLYLRERSCLLFGNPFNYQIRTRSTELPGNGVNSLLELAARRLVSTNAEIQYQVPDHLLEYLKPSYSRRCSICRNQILSEYSTRILNDRK